MRFFNNTKTEKSEIFYNTKQKDGLIYYPKTENLWFLLQKTQKGTWNSDEHDNNREAESCRVVGTGSSVVGSSAENTVQQSVQWASVSVVGCSAVDCIAVGCSECGRL